MKKTFLIAAGLLLAVATYHARSSNLARQPKAKAKAANAGVVSVPHCRLKFVQKATLASAQPGVLKFVTPTEGSKIKKDTVIASLKDEVAAAQLAIAKKEAENDVDIKYARKAADVALSELNKSKAANITEAGTVPAIEIERLQLAWERAGFQTEMAQQKQHIAGLTTKLRQAEVDRMKIKAPFDGVVTKVYKRTGEAIGNGEPLMDVVNPDLIRAEIQVPLADVLKLKLGDRVEVILKLKNSTLPESDRTVHGKITFIDKKADFAEGKVWVWANLKQGKLPLFEGLAGAVKIYPSK